MDRKEERPDRTPPTRDAFLENRSNGPARCESGYFATENRDEPKRAPAFLSIPRFGVRPVTLSAPRFLFPQQRNNGQGSFQRSSFVPSGKAPHQKPPDDHTET